MAEAKVPRLSAACIARRRQQFDCQMKKIEEQSDCDAESIKMAMSSFIILANDPDIKNSITIGEDLYFKEKKLIVQKKLDKIKKNRGGPGWSQNYMDDFFYTATIFEETCAEIDFIFSIDSINEQIDPRDVVVDFDQIVNDQCLRSVVVEIIARQCVQSLLLEDGDKMLDSERIQMYCMGVKNILAAVNRRWRTMVLDPTINDAVERRMARLDPTTNYRSFVVARVCLGQLPPHVVDHLSIAYGFAIVDDVLFTLAPFFNYTHVWAHRLLTLPCATAIATKQPLVTLGPSYLLPPVSSLSVDTKPESPATFLFLTGCSRQRCLYTLEQLSLASLVVRKLRVSTDAFRDDTKHRTDILQGEDQEFRCAIYTRDSDNRYLSRVMVLSPDSKYLVVQLCCAHLPAGFQPWFVIDTATGRVSFKLDRWATATPPLFMAFGAKRVVLYEWLVKEHGITPNTPTTNVQQLCAFPGDYAMTAKSFHLNEVGAMYKICGPVLLLNLLEEQIPHTVWRNAAIKGRYSSQDHHLMFHLEGETFIWMALDKNSPVQFQVIDFGGRVRRRIPKPSKLPMLGAVFCFPLTDTSGQKFFVVGNESVQQLPTFLFLPKIA